MLTTLPALTVSSIFLAWNACRRTARHRDRLLRERVAYMLWVAAHDGDAGSEEDDGGDEPSPDSELDRRLITYTFLDRR